MLPPVRVLDKRDGDKEARENKGRQGLGCLLSDVYADNIQKLILSLFGLGKADYNSLIGDLNLVEQATCVNV